MHLFSDIFIEAYKKLFSALQKWNRNILVDVVQDGPRPSPGWQWQCCAQNISGHPQPINQAAFLN